MSALLVEFIGPVVAALLAVGGYLVRQRFEDRQDRERTLDSIRVLILTSRDFVEPEQHAHRSAVEAEHCRAAVLSLRDFAAESIVHLRVRADRSAVTEIVSACNSYLEEADADPETSLTHLQQLRMRLRAALDNFSDNRSEVRRTGIDTNEPGALAFAA